MIEDELNKKQHFDVTIFQTQSFKEKMLQLIILIFNLM